MSWDCIIIYVIGIVVWPFRNRTVFPRRLIETVRQYFIRRHVLSTQLRHIYFAEPYYSYHRRQCKWPARMSVHKNMHLLYHSPRLHKKNVPEIPAPSSVNHHWLDIEVIFLYRANGITKVVDQSLNFVLLPYLCNEIVRAWLTASRGRAKTFKFYYRSMFIFHSIL